MNRKFLLTVAGIAAATLGLLVACGGGSGSSAPGSSTSAATGTTSGMLTAFGSVVVNGHEYATGTGTAVVDGDADDAASSMSALQVGMGVDVDVQNGAAQRVRFSSAVRGEVDAIDTLNSTITVLGQKVQVSAATLFAGSKTSGTTTTSVTQLSDIAVGDYVKVFGVLDCTSTGTGACTAGSNADNTQVLANLVVEPSAADVYRVIGYVENAAAGSFMINGLTVDYATTGTSATSCTPSPCAFANGDFVEVRSLTAPTGTGSSLSLAATRIRTARMAPVLVAGTTVSLEGPVALLSTSGNTFDVRGVTVDASALATTVATLSNGQIVEVTGTVSATGTIVASAITVESHATFVLTAPLDADSATAGTVTLLGQTLAVNSATCFVDRASDVRPFNLSNFATVLNLKDQLVVSGYSGAGGMIATRVERVPAPMMATDGVVGVVSADSATASTVTIAGVTATLGSGTMIEYFGANTTPTLAGFFSAIALQSSVVAIVGTPGASAGTISATRAFVMPSTTEWASGPRH